MKQRVYSFIRGLLPVGAKGYLSRSLYMLGLKPTVEKSDSAFEKGVVVFSCDFEMAWAFRFSKKQGGKAHDKGIQERLNIPIILNLFERYDIPCTWSTVGHLMLVSCSKTNGSIHSDMPRPGHFENKNWRFQHGDWYQHDPGTDYMNDPAWYAPDLVEKIINSCVKHEIGCHTFSHIDFTDKNCTADLARAELAKCVEVAALNGIELRSMVFPGGTEGHHQILKDYGFSCYRKPMVYEVAMPSVDQYGLIAIPSSYGMDKPDYNWSEKTCFRIVKRYIDQAAAKKKVCHLWFHPSMHPWYLENVFPAILEYVDRKRSEGMIEVNTMGELASKIKN